MTTSEAPEQRFPNASNGRETFQSADLLGHKPKQEIVSGNCFAEFVSYNGEGESLKSGRNRRLIEAWWFYCGFVCSFLEYLVSKY